MSERGRKIYTDCCLTLASPVPRAYRLCVCRCVQDAVRHCRVAGCHHALIVERFAVLCRKLDPGILLQLTARGDKREGEHKPLATNEVAKGFGTVPGEALTGTCAVLCHALVPVVS